MINVYSDSSQIALKYLKDTEANFNNILIMTTVSGILFFPII